MKNFPNLWKIDSAVDSFKKDNQRVINIPFNHDQPMGLIFGIEEELIEKGKFGLDTGSDGFSRDWYIDDISESRIKYILKYLKQRHIKFTIR